MYKEFWKEERTNGFKMKRFIPTHEYDERNQKFYHSKEWLKLRKYVLLLEPLCVDCLKQDIITEAIDVHHIIEVNDDWELRLELDNCVGLCKSCHWKHTLQEMKDRKEDKQRIIIDETMNDLESHINNKKDN